MHDLWIWSIYTSKAEFLSCLFLSHFETMIRMLSTFPVIAGSTWAEYKVGGTPHKNQISFRMLFSAHAQIEISPFKNLNNVLHNILLKFSGQRRVLLASNL